MTGHHLEQVKRAWDLFALPVLFLAAIAGSGFAWAFINAAVTR